MELRQLRYFVATAEELHFGRAARRVHVAQPSLSRQIKLLERELGVRLFDRDTRRVRLTGAGREYLAEARGLLSRLTVAAETARRAERGELGRLGIGFVYLVALDVLPSLLRRFRASYPDVKLELHELSTEAQIAGVRDGSLDVGIVRTPSAIRALAVARIHRDEQVVALPATHPLAAGTSVKLKELRAERFIMFPRNDGTAMYDAIVGACAKAGFSPHIVQEAHLYTTIVSLVAAGIGIAILPGVSARIRHDGVVYRRLLPRLPVDTGLVWNADEAMSKPALRAFLESAGVAVLRRSRTAARPTA